LPSEFHRLQPLPAAQSLPNARPKGAPNQTPADRTLCHPSAVGVIPSLRRTPLGRQYRSLHYRTNALHQFERLTTARTKHDVRMFFGRRHVVTSLSPAMKSGQRCLRAPRLARPVNAQPSRFAVFTVGKSIVEQVGTKVKRTAAAPSHSLLIWRASCKGQALLAAGTTRRLVDAHDVC